MVTVLLYCETECSSGCRVW